LLVYQGSPGGIGSTPTATTPSSSRARGTPTRELAERGVRRRLHLPSDPAAPSPLRELAARAALVVTEDFPAPPFPAWTERLAARIQAPVWAVDCACIVPMRLQPRRFERAFELRRHNQQAYAERVPRPWPETDLTPAATTGRCRSNPWT
jgi:hypothetical protein